MSHDDIEIREELGSGSYGVVYLGVITATGQSVAVKTCRDTVDKTTKAKFLMEARWSKCLSLFSLFKIQIVCSILLMSVIVTLY